jgi:3,4-dihydroxy 2-butanone 4-phosphate synthase / GTP cyclohydrolase II
MAQFAHTQAPFRSGLGAFTLHAYEIDGQEHVALVCGDVSTAEAPPLVRIQSSCITGTALLAELCDCRQQLHEAMRLIETDGLGVVVYLAQEGRSHGLVEKVAQLELIAAGADTVDAAEARGQEVDLRRYDHGAIILRSILGTTPIRLLTNNPEKLVGVEAAGLTVAERIPLETEPTPGNRDYLRTKRDRLGHILTMV